MLTLGLLPPNAMLLTTGICQLFLHWLGDTRMWNMLPMLATRFGKEFNDIDDHRVSFKTEEAWQGHLCILLIEFANLQREASFIGWFPHCMLVHIFLRQI